MKASLFILAVLSSLLAHVSSQGITIAYPPAGANIYKGTQVSVQVIKNAHIMASTEIGLAIGIHSCENGQCPPAESNLGTVLYAGPFLPSVHEGHGQEYENISVTIPSYVPDGHSVLNVVRFFLIGAGPSATIGSATVHINVV
ncbi:hypothetical protein DM01DRAFT_327284 [Hesseltinella vesiculosa]|uniref:Phosphatidylglycerol/phosphatidylinositol transfer protein n=1 Tax=Hesseltinella vesiculosa TaxID=101127 RepID=A0A1X2G9Y0_9FUNG|nr:hypothetical protein DM01DRAFT_327284 [Hesseltinella vesiculosa]